jgi:hypothetical protein
LLFWIVLIEAWVTMSLLPSQQAVDAALQRYFLFVADLYLDLLLDPFQLVADIYCDRRVNVLLLLSPTSSSLCRTLTLLTGGTY